MRPGDRLVCALVTQPTANQFKEWPLHITIVPWFRLPLSDDELVTLLNQSLSHISSFEVKVGEEVKFGHHGSKLARLVVLPSPLINIEQSIRRSLKDSGAWLVDETTKRQREYKPHVTRQQDNQLKDGERFYCQRLYLIEQTGEYKAIKKTLELRNY